MEYGGAGAGFASGEPLDVHLRRAVSVGWAAKGAVVGARGGWLYCKKKCYIAKKYQKSSHLHVVTDGPP